MNSNNFNKKDQINFLYSDFENHLESFISHFIDGETKDRFSYSIKKYGKSSYIMYSKLIYGTDCILINSNSIYVNTIYELFQFIKKYSENPIDNLSIIFIYEHFIDSETITSVNNNNTINDILTGLDNQLVNVEEDTPDSDDESEVSDTSVNNDIQKNTNILQSSNLAAFLKTLRDPLNPPYIFNITNDYFYLDSPKIVNRLANMGSIEFELTLLNTDDNDIIENISSQLKKIKHSDKGLVEEFSNDMSPEMLDTIKSCLKDNRYVNRNEYNKDIKKNIVKTFTPYYKIKSITGFEEDYVKVTIIIYVPPNKSLNDVDSHLKSVYNEIKVVKKTRGWSGRKLSDDNIYYEITNEKKDSNLLLDNKFKRSSIYSLGSPFPEGVFSIISKYLNNIIDD